MAAGTQPTLVVISGYFSPLHCGHLDMIEGGASLGDELLVIVNNNAQQIMKKGKVILDEQDRLRIVSALRAVDHAMVAVDDDATVCRTLELVAERHSDRRIIFGNGGDRDTSAAVPEAEVCARHGIEMRFDVGGTTKRDSSSRLIEELGLADDPA
ncbi:adenylyltransferase/cytidyltransferase family protein [Candidatus Poriferisocius sp.]|uniref:adenylyltransferase/cytidyltransferase family protein n=1 Tax=Candidatus Poriferisocius sp. TaxID=3101276 RepID=UPI003B58BA8C